MYRKQNFRSNSRNLHEFALNIIIVPSYRQEGCLNVTHKRHYFFSQHVLTGKRFGFLLWVWFFISLSLSAVQISSLPKQETSWGSCSTAYRKKPANGLQALAQSTLKPAWLIGDLLLHGLHLSPPLTSCEEQKILDLWQSLTFASIRNEPQKACNQCCVAQTNSGLCLVWLPSLTEVGATLQKPISLVNTYPNMGTGCRMRLCPKTIKI